MKYFLDQIQKALELDLYYLALFTSLIIPDICGAIDSVNGEANRFKYINWFDKYVAQKYSGFFTGEDCWHLRCSMLHQGSSQHPKIEYSRIIFVEPSDTKNILHNNILDDALNIYVIIFCMDIISGSLVWLQQIEGTELYKRNYNKFLRRYPNGLLPYISGIPVIS